MSNKIREIEEERVEFNTHTHTKNSNNPKVFLIKPPIHKCDWDLGDILAIARSQGKRLLGTKERVRVLELERRDYGYVAFVVKAGCSSPLVVNGTEKEKP